MVYVNELHKNAHTWEGGVFANMADFILDAVQNFLVEEILECIISISLNLTSYVVELYHILVNILPICYR